MSADLDERQVTPDADAHDPGQRNADAVFNDLTTQEHLNKDGVPGSLYNPRGDSSKNTDSDQEQKSLNELESGSVAESVGEDGSKLGNGFVNSDKGASRRSKIKSFVSKKKWAIVAAATPLLGVIIGLVMLLVFANSLKIPNLAQHITTFEFARLTRQFSATADRAAEQDLAIEATNDTVYGKLKAQYSGMRDKTWGKLDRFRPSQVMKTLGRENGLKINASPPTLTGRVTLQSVELNGTTYDIKTTSGYKRFVPGIRQFDQFKNDVNFSRNFAPDFIETMAANDTGSIVRASVAKDIRQKLGISLLAWTVGKYKNKTLAEAERVNDTEAFNKINEPNVDGTGVAAVDSTANAAERQTQADVQNPVSLAKVEAQSGIDPAVTQIIDKGVGQSTLQTVTGYINPAYAFAVPACIIYEGSINKAGPTIDSQTTEQQRAYYLVASAADQQKQGTYANDAQGEGLTTAINAMNTKLGDTTTSNAEVRAAGGIPNTTATQIPTEASAFGDYTLFNLIPGFGGSAIASLVQKVAGVGCPLLTNVASGLAIGVAIQIGVAIASIFTGPAAAGAEASARTATDAVVTETADTITQRIVSALTDKLSQTFSKDGASRIALKMRETLGIKNLTKETAKVTGLVGLTVLAKLLVMSKSHQNYNGLEQGSDFANEADAGGNLQAGELSRAQNFGRPLTYAETSQSDQSDQTFTAYRNSQKSFTDRYFAISNADSLVSKIALSVSSLTGTAVVNSLTKLESTILRPLSYLGSLLTLSGTAHAAPITDPATEYYGNVQFGWSQAEEKLISSDNSYLPLENQAILDQSGLEDSIANQYAQCFGYKYDSGGDGTFDPTDPNSDMKLDITGNGSLGSLLEGGQIKRAVNGDVLADNSTCSPAQLGPGNMNGLVFRFRLAMSYDTAVNQLTNEQSVTKT